MAITCCGCECHKKHDESEREQRESEQRVMSDALDIMLETGADYFTAKHHAHEREFIRVIKGDLEDSRA